MSRWIAFDPQSAAAIKAALQVSPELQGRGDALGAALSSARESVVLMPAAQRGHLIVAQLRRPQSASSASFPVSYAATGVLGLMDEPVYEEEPPQPKKWWQKLLE